MKNWTELVDNTWTLFLDRDGVINVRLIDDYVKNIDEFEFIDGVLEAMSIFNKVFGRIILVTNQQGVGKGLMTMSQLDEVHSFMLQNIENQNGRIDKIYSCPQLKSEPDNFRKPSPKMAFMAKADFPEIDLSKSIMIGDADSDIKFGKNAGMMTVFVGNDECKTQPDDNFENLYDFAKQWKH